jgi:hypothetical protein
LKKFLINFFVYLLCIFIISQIQFFFFEPIFSAEHLIFPYAIHPFDICSVYPDTWKAIKTAYIITFLCCYSILHFNISSFIQKKFLFKKSKKSKNSKKIKTSNISIPTFNYKFCSKRIKKDTNLDENYSLKLLVGLDENENPIYINEKRIVPKYINNWNNWEWKNFVCHVPFFEAINKI